MKTSKRIMKKRISRVVRISPLAYNLLKETQRLYEKKIGFSLTLSQLLEKAILNLSKEEK